MARKAASAVDALNLIIEEQRLLAARAQAARDAAALEVGLIVLEAGGGQLAPDALRSMIGAAVKGATHPKGERNG